MTLTMTDLFCGAGGSSTGAVAAGITVAMAANHWSRAIETHNTNHPDTRHDCADISQVDPRRYPGTDILWASPECTNHSQAKGIKRAIDSTPDMFGLTLPDEAADRSRATMWDVIRFAEHHRYRAIIVENVVDAARWELWEAWRHALTALGYQCKIVYLNSMHASTGGLPAPQSRDRLYVVAWRTGHPAPDLERWLRPAAACPVCGPIRAVQAFKNGKAWGRYRAQYLYRCPNISCRNSIVEPAWLPAAAAIDWTLTGQRIGDRDRPLAGNTMARIQAGLLRHHRTTQYAPAGIDGREGLLVPLRNHNTSKTTAEPMDTIAAAGNHHALVMRNNTGGAEMLTPVDQVLRTLTTAGHQSLVQWQLVIDYNGPARRIDDVLPTQTTIEGDGLATTAVDINDCRFRMLEPHEIAAGMAFPADYQILGNKREQVRQAGNAVTPPASRDLLAAVAAALA